MVFSIQHELPGRVRLRLAGGALTFDRADVLQEVCARHPQVKRVKIFERLGDVVLEYSGDRACLLEYISGLGWEEMSAPEYVLESSSREMNAYYWEKLISKCLWRGLQWLFFPNRLRQLLTIKNALPYVRRAVAALMRGEWTVDLLDGAAITASVLHGDISSAGSVMFLLQIGEILEEWTHKKSVGDLARSLSLQVEQVWKLEGGELYLEDISRIQPGDRIRVHMGHLIPFDGEVLDGQGMVNQASLTGEGIAVAKLPGDSVFAGTVLEEGELTLAVREQAGGSRFEKIAAMIEESEKLKSKLEGKAEHLADRLVPYTLAGALLTYVLTGNLTKAMTVLMVDFSCALKLAMPISVLSAIKEAGEQGITVKGGRFLEAVAEADTIVFDKTGTLTKAQPKVAGVAIFGELGPREALRLAACLEEHFPHSMAKAVVKAAQEAKLIHEELHSQVEYIVAHGIASRVEGRKVLIGSYHFVFEDEGCRIPEGKEEVFASLPKEYSHLYLSIEGQLAAVICVEDPLREEASEVVARLKALGLERLVMMTGDSQHTAKAVAAKVGLSQYRAEVLPQDKAAFVEEAKAQGGKIIMVGDGINDSPALSAAEVGIAISDGAQLAREIADIIISQDSLEGLVSLRLLSQALMRRIQSNYRYIVGGNLLLLALGLAGWITPTVAALLHNGSTLAIGLRSMGKLQSD